ncbi:hypothetical protein GQ53DRAFT_819867 [Thozetella sp. PMI_491]|nr:hypothetical protein GQ53DRAFT_819867 [Thozetella sp. PMI_491]
MPRVPSTREVVPGATVNIVLKADQPTGRTVSGVIGQVLTRGNHPRGIKVRLTDGRVGRVQSMATAGAPSTGDLPASLGDDPPPAAGHSGFVRPSRGGDGSLERGDDVPSQQIGLDAYITQAKPRGGRRGKGPKATASADAGPSSADASAQLDAQRPPGSDTLTCPVCGTFTGDEAAISYHVASHFDSDS